MRTGRQPRPQRSLSEFDNSLIRAARQRTAHLSLHARIAFVAEIYILASSHSILRFVTIIQTRRRKLFRKVGWYK